MPQPAADPLAKPPPHPGEMLRQHVLPALRLPVTQAARELGITRQTLHRILAGSAAVTPEMEDALLHTIAVLDGTPFPSTARLAGRWLRGRLPALRARRATEAGPESAYCAEVVAVTYEDMGLLPPDRRPNWYDPGRFWSGDGLVLREGFTLGGEIAVALPA